MSHVAHMDESCHTYEWVMSHTKSVRWKKSRWLSERKYESWHTYKCVASHIWSRHVRHMNESCHTRGLRGGRHVDYLGAIWLLEWVMSHIYISHAPRMNGSCHTRGWVISHMTSLHAHVTRNESFEMSHVTSMNDSCHIHKWVISCMDESWMSHVT